MYFVVCCLCHAKVRVVHVYMYMYITLLMLDCLCLQCVIGFKTCLKITQHLNSASCNFDLHNIV